MQHNSTSIDQMKTSLSDTVSSTLVFPHPGSAESVCYYAMIASDVNNLGSHSAPHYVIFYMCPFGRAGRPRHLARHQLKDGEDLHEWRGCLSPAVRPHHGSCRVVIVKIGIIHQLWIYWCVRSNWPEWWTPLTHSLKPNMLVLSQNHVQCTT